MHSRIIQLEVTAIDKSNLMEDYNIPDWFTEGVADYVAESDRKEDLKWIKDAIFGSSKHAGLYETENLVEIHDIQAFQEDYFRGRYNTLQDEVAKMTLNDFTNGFQAYRIASLARDRFGFYIYINSELMPVDDFIRSLDMLNQKVFYIGGTLDYHY